MAFSTRNSAKAISPTTQLVNALINFGLDEPQSTWIPLSGAGSGAVQAAEAEDEAQLDREEDDLVAGGNQSTTNSRKPKLSPDNPTAKADFSISPPTAALANLSLGDNSEPQAGPSAPPVAKVPRSLKSLLRSSNHSLTIDTDDGPVERTLTSWKMADYAYKRDPCPFPTRARGLFTEKVNGGGEGDQYRIVARGYDKFFNVGEVSWTQWDNIPKHSSAPYELTQKSNGCIILISSLSPQHILVTSKHSLGANASLQTDMSHSQRGEYWLERHLAKVGKSKADLAKELWDQNLTAVAELCDDDFEEHVLAYPPELTGLHLHGLNKNEPVLVSLPSTTVSAFATAWGMIPTPFSVFPSVLAVKTYCATVEAAGGVEDPATGRISPVEGFVVRGAKKGGEKGEPFFWKVKYDQPYLMYREWRELTRKLLAEFPEVTVKPAKLRNKESRLYLWWVHSQMEKDITQFDSWKVGKGIIKTREDFLSWSKTPEGKEQARQLGQEVKDDVDTKAQEAKTFDRTLIVPVAVQGCGKTALALELAHLFGWEHTQSDDFLMKKPGPHFIKAVKTLLTTSPVVIADKNNHQRKLRADLVATAASLAPKHRTRVVGLVWDIEALPRDKLHALCTGRIEKRGQNHQSLRAGEGHEGAIWQFLGQWEKFDPATNDEDGRFDEVVEMRPAWNRREALDHAVGELCRIFGVEEPSEERREEAVRVADAYKPKVRKEVALAKLEKLTAPRYYAIAVEADLNKLLADVLPAEAKGPGSVWAYLQSEDRVEKHPHVTLVHELELKSDDPAFREQKQALWDRYAALVTRSTEPVGIPKELEVEVSLGPRVVWDGRAVAIEVSGLHPVVGEVDEWLVGGRAAHITVGVAEGVRPFEGKGILEAVLEGKEEGVMGGGRIGVAQMEVVKCGGKLAGLR